MHTLALAYRLFKQFQKGGGWGVVSRGRGGVCNLICRSLFYYYGDLFYYSTIYFLLKERNRERDRERDRGKDREKNREKNREKDRERNIEREMKKVDLP